MITLADPEHGTVRAYKRGCRCTSCRDANKVHARKYRRDNLKARRAYGRKYERDRRRREPLTASQKRVKQNRDHVRIYGITLEEKKALLAGQDNRCAMCGARSPGHHAGWQTEHDHDTKVVRGITCNRCNTLLGMLGDNLKAVEETVERIREYLTTGATKTLWRLAFIRGAK